jgi:hypothetical protein
MGDIFSSLNRAMKKDRKAEGEDIAREQEYSNTMKALGMDELGRYKNPTTTAGQEKELSDYSKEMGDKTAEFYKEAGMSGNSEEIASMKKWSDDVKGIRFDMLETTKHQSWTHALQSLGMSQDAARYIAMLHTQDREEKIQIYSQLMGAIGGLVSKRSGRG